MIIGCKYLVTKLRMLKLLQNQFKKREINNLSYKYKDFNRQRDSQIFMKWN